MAPQGYVFKDGGTTPPASSADALSYEPYTVDAARDLVNDVTMTLRPDVNISSHELARHGNINPSILQSRDGAAVEETLDLGWNKPVHAIPDPVVPGLPNAQLWPYLRRFNKDVIDVRAVQYPNNDSGMDLLEAWEDDHAAEKMTLHLQRIYLNIVLGLSSLVKQVARLRSWKETQRTAVFAVVYFTACILNMVMPLLLLTMVILISSPRARSLLFPSAPRALVSVKTGGIQKPQAGELGSFDSLTGAPENVPGEAAEEEATKFIDNIRHLIMRAVGMHEQDTPDGDPLEGKVPKSVRRGLKFIKDSASAPGHAQEGCDVTEKPMEEILWSQAKPEILWPIVKTAPHFVGEVVDTWERVANALSPPPPFSPFLRLRLVILIFPLFLMSLLTSAGMVYQVVNYAVGIGIFAEPVLTAAYNWINARFPNWMQLLDPKVTILKDVPNNKQVALTLLRLGEAHRTPLPPLPRSNQTDGVDEKLLNVDELPLSTSTAEVQRAVYPNDVKKAHDDEPQTADNHGQPPSKRMSKFVAFLKGNTRAVVETKLAVERVRATMGSEKSKETLGVLPKPENLIYAGPNEYRARRDGQQGWIYIISSATSPWLVFTKRRWLNPNSGDVQDDDVSLPINSIQRLKRVPALQSRVMHAAADWVTEKDLLGGVETTDMAGVTQKWSALPERDELYNRLVAIGEQKWENV